ncbi:MAG: phenylalanine--tRNA ligase subunit beta [Bacteroides sp.]|nr:phenylalanine--tRNA ligase subunit beta [Prevotella sp.]MCM1407555.1 phenylalanine--tRNA ligase subunit beta [Treponema brennaborense]MCM1469295.1 phenylalanine--tRNA ligase subunit beta [Bacteroides sp.]
MPKIEVNEKLFFNLTGKKYNYDALEQKLTCAKAELDEKPDTELPENQRVIKIELNDTNRPDLWSTAGVARQIRLHDGGKHADYEKFLSRRGALKDCGNRIVSVDPELKNIRPFMAAFVISGKPIDEPMLLDIIQTQEKLCWNFGRKRRSISMGVYRDANIQWPVNYHAVNPDETSFVPLQCSERMTCRQILSEHPKGKEYGWILEGCKKFPLLSDAKGETLSMAPIINSATLGAVQVGDSDLLVEVTGSDMASLLLTANIVACDFADAGYEILPCLVRHPYDTGFGQDIIAPYYFQETTKTSAAAVNKLLGSDFSAQQIAEALERMGNSAEISGNDGEEIITLTPPPYRNDFLHEVDVIEDVMMGMTLSAFSPEKPHDFTIGRLSPLTLFSRQAKTLMVGMGYQEMIFNYLGSRRDFIERMNVSADNVIEIANPMSENYQFVRPSVIASLLGAEAVSANAVYPHKIFEIGKVAQLCKEENTGTRTRQYLGFMTAAGDANFNTAASEMATLLHFLNHEYIVAESFDPRFIPGRQASIVHNGKNIGIFGEIHPTVLENWQITVPCVAGEIDLEELLTEKNNQPEKPKTVQKNGKNGNDASPEEIFNAKIALKAAKIIKVERHPQADKLYVETLDDGSGSERIIVSGLVPYMSAESLLGKTVIIADNLKARKMRGIESRGMLLAAECKDADGNETVEVLNCPWAAPGTPVVLQGTNPASLKAEKIDADIFFSVPITVADNRVVIGKTALVADGKEITTESVKNGEVG